MIKKQFLISIFVSSLFFSSCSVLSTVSAGPAQREGMLSARLDKFTRAMYFESSKELSGYIEPAYQRAYFKAYNRRGDRKDFVESVVKSIDFYDDANSAVAFIRTKVLDKSSLYVRNEYQKLDWKFYSSEGGWKLHNIEQIEKSVFDNLSNE